ncbi:mitochondrial proton/calcium exchanger protein-like isoform X1 [Daphnia pulicaria]|uniref:mitochondrial proton/calcium exchanger protein-like isoform X1 n=1 Tax=Daphnia pulicaria TaxID=35523 RepID=UPI001EEA8CCB|nr:mitochondrial proton/calcium exchanger protein-like isoform X1 [Daphnia pulicaria]
MLRSASCLRHPQVLKSLRHTNRAILVTRCRKTPNRYFQTTVTRWADITPNRPSSAVEASILSYKLDHKISEPNVSSISVKKPSLAKRILDELVHYYHGFRLLFIHVGISGNLLLRVLQGETLSRREKKQLVTTTSDVFRLVPFSVFIIVPFMELTLPIFLKLFPNMLPSTFQTADDRETKFKATLKVKLETAKFLQQTLDEMALTGSGHQSQTAQDFAKFFQKIRSSGQQASNEEILRFSKLFEDEITLDSLSRPQLTALCRVLEIAPIGTNNLLRFQLRMKLRHLAADDKLILKEGIGSLSISELQAACRERGMRSLGVSEIRLKSQLFQWLDLSMGGKVPPSLLLLSRALYLPENVSATEQLKATIASLPESVAAQTSDAINHRRGKINNQARIEALRVEQAKIHEERKETHVGQVAFDTKKLTLTLADAALLENALESVGVQRNKQLLVAKGDLTDLKEEMADYREDIKELEDLLQSPERKRLVLRESKAARRLFQTVNRMIQKLENHIEGPALSEGQLNTKDKEEIVSIEELIASIRRINAIEDSANLHKIVHILDHIDVDRDGVITVEEVMKVIELLEEEGINLTAKQMTEILGVVSKEEFLEMEKKIEKTLGQVVNSRKPDADCLTSQSLLAKTDERNNCVEQIMIGDVKNSINREKLKSGRELPREPLDIAEVEKILSLVTQLKTLYAHEVGQSKENIKPIFFRAQARIGSSSGLNP